MDKKPSFTSLRWKQVEDVFHGALERPRDDRSEYVRSACAGDEELQAEVDRLLAGHYPSDQFIEPPDAALAGLERFEDAERAPGAGCIGDFEVVRVIASGGMGTVYEALQKDPRRSVALKVLRAGRASPAALRRFQHEWQVLGRLRHPMIAQVYKAGAYREGVTEVPYFAMEYIPGAKPIVDYARDADLAMTERLEMFADICDAVQHGHQHGVIHRDLKPANIVVDSAGRTKVIDFGVARATNRDLAATTMQTDVGQLVGTLVYMSPEQCAADPNEIDTRSDVYSLGVVLFELLCGCLPYDVRRRSIPDAARAIQHLPPRRPSSINPDVCGDIESIILKSLEKNPPRRYQTASDFATDIRRCLSHQPVEAQPASMSYHLRLFARRNRAAVFAATCVLIVLVAGAVVSTALAFKATRAARGEAQARDGAERTTAFLQHMISSASPYRTGQNVTIIDMLEVAAERVNTELAGQPEAEAGVRYAFGKTYADLWLWDDAIPHLRRALALHSELYGELHPKVADCLSILGRALTFQNNGEAILLQRKALRIRRELHGEHHPLVAESMGNLAYALWAATGIPQWGESERYYIRALDRYSRLGAGNDRDVARFTYSLAAMYSTQGRTEESGALFDDALSMYRAVKAESGIEDAYMVRVMYGYAYVLERLGRHDDAATLLTESLELTPEGLAETQVFDAKWRLGAIRHNMREYQSAQRHYRESLAVRCQWLSREFPQRAMELAGLATDLSDDANDDIRPYVEAFGAIGELSHIGNGELLRSMHDLGDVLQYTNPAAGEIVLRHCARTAARYMHRDNWFIADVDSIRGGCLTRLGRFAEAEPLVVETYPYLTRAGKKRQGRLLEALQRIVDLYEAWNRPQRAAFYRRMMLPERAGSLTPAPGFAGGFSAVSPAAPADPDMSTN